MIAGQAARRKARKGDDDDDDAPYVPAASRQPRSPKKDKKRDNGKKDGGRMVNGKGEANARSGGLAGVS